MCVRSLVRYQYWPKQDTLKRLHRTTTLTLRLTKRNSHPHTDRPNAIRYLSLSIASVRLVHPRLASIGRSVQGLSFRTKAGIIRYDAQIFNVCSKNWRVANLVCRSRSKLKNNEKIKTERQFQNDILTKRSCVNCETLAQTWLICSVVRCFCGGMVAQESRGIWFLSPSKDEGHAYIIHASDGRITPTGLLYRR